jgi:hypothetical protein
MAVLWLRFLREVEDSTREVSADLLASEDICEALTLCEEAAFSPEELEVYEDYWDQVRKEMGLFDSARTEGKAEGIAQTVIAAAQNNFSTEQIRLFSGLSEKRIREILERGNCTGGDCRSRE